MRCLAVVVQEQHSPGAQASCWASRRATAARDRPRSRPERCSLSFWSGRMPLPVSVSCRSAGWLRAHDRSTDSSAAVLLVICRCRAGAGAGAGASTLTGWPAGPPLAAPASCCSASSSGTGPSWPRTCCQCAGPALGRLPLPAGPAAAWCVPKQVPKQPAPHLERLPPLFALLAPELPPLPALTGCELGSPCCRSQLGSRRQAAPSGTLGGTGRRLVSVSTETLCGRARRSWLAKPPSRSSRREARLAIAAPSKCGAGASQA